MGIFSPLVNETWRDMVPVQTQASTSWLKHTSCAGKTNSKKPRASNATADGTFFDSLTDSQGIFSYLACTVFLATPQS